MKDQKNQITTNNEINLEADTLTDLPVADRQAEETRGGENHVGQIHIESFSWTISQTGAH